MTAVKQLVPKSRGPPVHLLSILSSLGRLNSSAHVRVSATQLLAAEKNVSQLLLHTAAYRTVSHLYFAINDLMGTGNYSAHRII